MCVVSLVAFSKSKRNVVVRVYRQYSTTTTHTCNLTSRLPTPSTSVTVHALSNSCTPYGSYTTLHSFPLKSVSPSIVVRGFPSSQWVTRLLRVKHFRGCHCLWSSCGRLARSCLSTIRFHCTQLVLPVQLMSAQPDVMVTALNQEIVTSLQPFFLITGVPCSISWK